jgi:peptidoglycan-N-acetylglucosamine deacetylase
MSLVIPLILTASSAACAAVGALAYATVAPDSQFWGPVICRGGKSEPERYALTFDDGPTRGSTEPILDILGELGVKATFFVIGANAANAPDLMRRMDVEGHIVANHSYNHSHVGVMRAGRYWDQQIGQTNRLIEQIIGRRPALFRPPMGIKHRHVCAAAQRHGHTVVTWSKRARDGVRTTAREILNRLVEFTEDGDILMMHDGIEPNAWRDPKPSIKAVRPLILSLRDRGLEPAPLSNLIGIEPYLRTSRGNKAIKRVDCESKNDYTQYQPQ